MQGIYFQLKNRARIDGCAYHTNIIMALTLCVINLTSFQAVLEISVNYFSLSQVRIWSSSARNDRFVCSAISTEQTGEDWCHVRETRIIYSWKWLELLRVLSNTYKTTVFPRFMIVIMCPRNFAAPKTILAKLVRVAFLTSISETGEVLFMTRVTHDGMGHWKITHEKLIYTHVCIMFLRVKIRQQKIQWKPFYIILQEEISTDSLQQIMIEYLCIYSYLV